MTTNRRTAEIHFLEPTLETITNHLIEQGCEIRILTSRTINIYRTLQYHLELTIKDTTLTLFIPDTTLQPKPRLHRNQHPLRPQPPRLNQQPNKHPQRKRSHVTILEIIYNHLTEKKYATYRTGGGIGIYKNWDHFARRHPDVYGHQQHTLHLFITETTITIHRATHLILTIDLNNPDSIQQITNVLEEAREHYDHQRTTRRPPRTKTRTKKYPVQRQPIHHDKPTTRRPKKNQPQKRPPTTHHRTTRKSTKLPRRNVLRHIQLQPKHQPILCPRRRPRPPKHHQKPNPRTHHQNPTKPRLQNRQPQRHQRHLLHNQPQRRPQTSRPRNPTRKTNRRKQMQQQTTNLLIILTTYFTIHAAIKLHQLSPWSNTIFKTTTHVAITIYQLEFYSLMAAFLLGTIIRETQ